MADAKVDQSLDAIIKERKISVRNGGRGRGLRRGGRGAARGVGGGRGGPAGRSFGRRPAAPANGGSIMKRRSGGGLPISPGKTAVMNRGIPDGQWDHDLYQNGARRRSGGVVAANGSGLGPAKLVIANLDFGVNDQDIQGLFQEFGNIRKAAVHYDRSGRSLGTADVLFERKQDAIKALKKYNGVSLDGRPMNIQMAGSAPPMVAVPQSRISGMGQQQRNNGVGATRGGFRGGARGGGRGGRGGGSAAAKKPAKSAADLDADLDAYNSKMQTD